MARPRWPSSAGSSAASAVSEPSWSVDEGGALVRPAAPLAPTREARTVRAEGHEPLRPDDAPCRTTWRPTTRPDDAPCRTTWRPTTRPDACADWLFTLDMVLVHRAFEERAASTRQSGVPPPPAPPVEAAPLAEALTARQKKRLRQRLAKDAAVAREASAAEAARASAEAEAQAARVAADAAAEAAYLDPVAVRRAEHNTTSQDL